MFDGSSLQQYFVRLLSHTPHYVIRRCDVKAFKRHLKAGKYQYQHIRQNESFVPEPSTEDTVEDDKPFLAVYNFGTPEMDVEMVQMIEAMNLETNIDLLAGVSRNERGNVQQSYGFSPTGHTRDPENHYISRPQQRTGNDNEHVKNQCRLYTKLVNHVMSKDPGVKELFGEDPDPIQAGKRRRNYPNIWDPQNDYVEGLTLGANLAWNGRTVPYRLSRGASKVLRVHTDSYNDPTDGNQVQGCSSAVFEAYRPNKRARFTAKDDDADNDQDVDQEGVVPLNSGVRAWSGMYKKHACGQSEERSRWMTVIFKELDALYGSQEEWKQSLMETLEEHFLDAVEHFLDDEENDFYEFARSFTKKLLLGNYHDSK